MHTPIGKAIAGGATVALATAISKGSAAAQRGDDFIKNSSSLEQAIEKGV